MKKIHELSELIKAHKIKYYNGHPEISDTDYDRLEDELRELAPDHPVLSMVGTVPKGLSKIKHDKKMLSLNKTYKKNELLSWMEDQEVVSTYKIDGVSGSLIYENGTLTIGKTRGDGSFGENITEKVKWVEGVPTNILEKGRLEVRGEIFCDQKNFLYLSDEMENLSLERPSSQRNIVAGLIGRKDHVSLNRYLNFMAFDIIFENKNLEKETEKYKWLDEQGFVHPEFVLHKNDSHLDQVLDDAKNFMNEGEYQIDGLVFTFNDIKSHSKLGETAHHPRYKIAFKFPGESKVTKINELVWSVSRNGILTPVANVEPVELSGASISRVTLHNYGMVKANNLKIGDEIEIIRSGEVIPKFLSVKKPSNNTFSVPSNCPSCNESLITEDIRLFCKNDFCPAKKLDEILNFVQKIGIDDLSSRRIEELMSHKLVLEIPDLYELTQEKLMTLDKVKEKLSNKLIKSINASKNVDLLTFVSSLGIEGGAINKCEKIVKGGFNSIESFLGLNEEQLSSIEGFALVSSQKFIKSLNSKKLLIKKLMAKGFTLESNDVASEGLLVGKKLCITGTLSRKRSDIEKDIKSHGGAMVSSVSKNTDFLITNDANSNSSKAKKARELNIKILSEEDLYNSFLSK